MGFGFWASALLLDLLDVVTFPRHGTRADAAKRRALRLACCPETQMQGGRREVTGTQRAPCPLNGGICLKSYGDP